MNNPSAGRRRKRGVWVLLLLIFVTGAVYRFWGLSSVYQRVDDIPLARHIERIYNGHWEPNPVYYYPVFFNYLVAGGLRAVSLVVDIAGAHPGKGLYPFSFDQVLLAARLLSAFLGSLTILLVFAVGRRLFGTNTGILSAFFFSVAIIPIVYSHQIVLDAPMTFFFALAVFFCSALLEKRGWPEYLLAGFACGLATATKYNGVFVLAALALGHVIGAPKADRSRSFKWIVDPRIYAAGLSAAAGFFLAHPFALLHFRRFVRASKLLIGVVHEPESYLRHIQPQTLLEHIQVNKYWLAVKNILSAEGPVLLALTALGVLAFLLFRNRKSTFTALSGLAYFLGALGFLGFSRYRDLSTFAIFTSLFAALGVGMISRPLREHGRTARALLVFLFIMVVGTLEFSALSKAYILWEDDTTEVAERWIERNIPKGSFIGREWFSPPLAGSDFRSLSRPFLHSRGFAPYKRFDFIITSSAASAHFFRYEKYYAGIVRIHRELKAASEHVKEFFFRPIEYKNPELHLYTTWSPPRRRQRMSLPWAVPEEDPAREFEVLDGSPYEKSVMTFTLRDGQKMERRIISHGRVPEVAAFVIPGTGRGEIIISSLLSQKRLRPEDGRTAAIVFRPRRPFPFFRSVYGITVRGRGSVEGATVKLCADPFSIAQEFFRLQDFSRAKEYFLKALDDGRPSTEDLELHLYLALCTSRLGREEDARAHLAQAASHPLWKRYLDLWRPDGDEEKWTRRFERFSGLSFRLFEEALTHLVEEPASPELRLPAQPHRLFLQFYDPAGRGGPAGELEVIVRSPGGEQRSTRPIVLEPAAHPGFCAASIPYTGPGLGTTVQFIVRPEPTAKVAFEFLRISPDIRSFVREKEALFRPLIESFSLMPENE